MLGILECHVLRIGLITQAISLILEYVVLECPWKHYFKPIETPVEKGLALSLYQCFKIDDEKRRQAISPMLVL